MRTVDRGQLLERFNEYLDAKNEVIIEEWDYLPSEILIKVDPRRYDNHFEYYIESLIDKGDLKVIDGEFYLIE